MTAQFQEIRSAVLLSKQIFTNGTSDLTRTSIRQRQPLCTHLLGDILKSPVFSLEHAGCR